MATLAQQEKPFIDSLSSETGKDFEAWIRVIDASGISERGAIRDWLQNAQNLPYMTAHKLSHLHREYRELFGPKLEYHTEIRDGGGTLIYASLETTFELSWASGGFEAVMIIQIPAEANWEAMTHTAIAERPRILSLIGQLAVRDQTENEGAFVIGPDAIRILRQKPGQ